ncbi:MAG: protein-disulfide reductase DsbD family protein [Acidobacteriaceae bacterium]|nr:protein-disulfide reductase DsbD family protein [Acidobacteriaceae bacterium]
MSKMTSRARRLLLSSFVLFAALFASTAATARGQIQEVGDGTAGPFKAEHLTAEIVTLSPQVAAGGHVTVGLLLTLEEHWHVYWINAGDSGEPPKITWTLPKGIVAGPMQFPPPQRLPLGPFMDYGYEDQVAFPIEITAAKSLKPGKLHLDAKVTWIVCSDRCIPGKAHLGLDLNVVKGPLPASPVVGALGQAIGWLPKPLPAEQKLVAIADGKTIALTLTGAEKQADAEFYPFDKDVIANAADQIVEPLNDGVRLRLERAQDPDHADQSAALPKSLHGLLKLGKDDDAVAYEVDLPVPTGVVPPLSPTGKKALPANVKPATAEITVFSALALAFLGGIILNLMPCVFPVLFLKGLALVNSGNEERSRQRMHGLVYTGGILISFWIIVGSLLALRAGGQQLGWGFQLQSPGFVAILALIMFFLALSLAGQFELGLSLTSAGNDLTRKQGFAGSFFTGMLAVVAATPCMGPLMGAAVGFALAQPSWVTFLVFTSLALGLALPYLILSLNPQWTSILPRPGAWMELLKQLTAVPLFATAIWLTWVYGKLYSAGNNGIDRIAVLLGAFLLLAIAGWALGRWPAKWGSAITALIFIALAIILPLRKPKAEALTWKPWSPEALAAARATGHPVFVDYTAAWCLSCQVNERVVLQNKEIVSKLGDAHVELLKADWTNYDPAITQSLADVNRSGVPTYVIFPPGQKSNADVLPEILTKDIVSQALERDVTKP